MQSKSIAIQTIRIEKLLKCGSPILVVKAVILPNLVYDKMRLLYNITKSSIDLPQKKGGSTVGL